MSILGDKLGLRKRNIFDSAYPKREIAVIVVLLYLAPFTTPLLTYAAFALCVYRIVVCDARVFATDYAVLLPMSQLFRANGTSLLAYLCLIAAVRYFVSCRLERQRSYALILIVLNYLMMRMQWNISALVLCFGQLFLLCVLLPKQDACSAVRTIMAFCLSLLVMSVFAYLFRNTSQIYAIRGSETPAFWGSSLRRFRGLFEDPNYYMMLLVTAMALLVGLLDRGQIDVIPFCLLQAAFTFFGALTYSKTFFLMLLILAVLGIACLFQNRKYLIGAVMLTLFAAALWLLVSGTTIFSVVLHRFSTADSLDALTTGRNEVYAAYFEEITKDIPTFFFGKGLAADGLTKDPHNLFLEIAYYLGIVGLGLMTALCASLLSALRNCAYKAQKQKWLPKNITVIMVLFLHVTLHGMFSVITYAVFFLAFLSTMPGRQKET